MFSVGCHFAQPAAFASLHGRPCCELPSLQRCFFPSKSAQRVERGHVVFPTMVAAQQPKAASPQLRIFHGQDLKGKDLQHVMARPRIDFESILRTVCKNCEFVGVIPVCPSAYFNSQMSVQVQPIVQAVKDQGDAAVKQYTEKFDRVQLDTVCLPIEVSIHKTLTAILHHLVRSNCPPSYCLERSVFCRIFQSHSFLQKLFLPFRLHSTTFMLSMKRSRRIH